MYVNTEANTARDDAVGCKGCQGASCGQDKGCREPSQAAELSKAEHFLGRQTRTDQPFRWCLHYCFMRISS